MKLRVIPEIHSYFGPELGYGLGSDGLVPDDKPITRVVKAVTIITIVIAVIGAVIAF